MRHLVLVSTLVSSLALSLAAQGQGGQTQPPSAGSAAGSPPFPLAAPAGSDGNAKTVAPGSVNQGPFDPATWKFEPAFNPPPGARLWNPVRLKMQQGGKVTGARGVAAELGPLANTQGKPEVGPLPRRSRRLLARRARPRRQHRW